MIKSNEKMSIQTTSVDRKVKLCKALEEDLLESNDKYETVKFFRRNITTVTIWLKTIRAYYEKKEINVEDIFRRANQITNTSRPSVVSILDEAKAKGYLLFTMNKKDKRSYDIKPSKLTIEQFEKWAEVFNV